MKTIKAYEMGYEAFNAGESEESCPFGFDRYYARKEWMEGYAKAEAELLDCDCGDCPACDYIAENR